MKHGVKPTRAQKQIIRSKRLDPNNWFVVKDEPNKMTLVHRHFDNKVRIIQKGDKYND